ncbi:MAG: RNA-binding protein [Syntrophomonadaceae bacterium]|nr:RNA-binding protein [Syntrophomonadaceae bacterium]
MQDEDLVGRLVFSRAGRDRGRALLVLKMLNDRLVMVVDGDLRTLENPKPKNLKHLQVTNRVARDVREKVARGDPLDNALIRRAIDALAGEGYWREGGPEGD